MASQMDTLLDRADSASIRIENDLARLARGLRRVTVQVHNGSGGGCGVIWRSDGLIVTNAHVATGAEQTVVLDDGRAFRAALVARDRHRDLAALQIEATGLAAAEVRDPASLRPGEWVMAIGSPAGNIGAVAQGILHAAPASGLASRWIQADIRLAPGNSGGPLADAQGRVIGINSMIVEGLALAVSSKSVERFLQGKGPRIGVTVQPAHIRSEQSVAFGLCVVAIEPNSAAHLSGVMVGDVLLGAGGARFQELEDLAEAIAAAARESGTLDLDLIRAGASMRCAVHVARQMEAA